MEQTVTNEDFDKSHGSTLDKFLEQEGIGVDEPQPEALPIIYVKGDATEPTGEGKKVIAHICNDVGKWGAGFTASLDRKGDFPRTAYKLWYNNRDNMNQFGLGNVQLVPAAPDIMVANMIAQSGVRGPNNPTPINYKALTDCLHRLWQGLPKDATVHMPMIGTGLAGGSWEIIEKLIIEELSNKGIQVYVYIRL